jgi:hypothetical protein
MLKSDALRHLGCFYWFSLPPAARQGQMPSLGTLHASPVLAVQAAYCAARA